MGSGVGVGVGSGVWVGVGSGVGVGVGSGAAAQPVTAFVSIVTDPLRARARPSIVEPVVIVMEVSARMFPEKSEYVPMVAELPICQ